MENVKKLEGVSNLGALREIGHNKEGTIRMCVEEKREKHGREGPG